MGNIIYFFIKDQVDQGCVKIKYCPTTEMVADDYTKPLQGTLFKKMRALIVKCPIELEPEKQVLRPVDIKRKAQVTEECVGKYRVDKTSRTTARSKKEPDQRIHTTVRPRIQAKYTKVGSRSERRIQPPTNQCMVYSKQ